jgi:hypothetical protein
MSCVLILLMAIDIVHVVVICRVLLPLLLYPRGEVKRNILESVTIVVLIGFYL